MLLLFYARIPLTAFVRSSATAAAEPFLRDRIQLMFSCPKKHHPRRESACEIGTGWFEVIGTNLHRGIFPRSGYVLSTLPISRIACKVALPMLSKACNVFEHWISPFLNITVVLRQ
jgi:hypothetical protein